MTHQHVSRVDSFIKTTLPDLLNVHEELDVIISTYKPFLNFGDVTSLVPQMPPKLRLLVHAGDYSSEGEVIETGQVLTFGGGVELLKRLRADRVRRSLTEVEMNALKSARESRAPKLAFVYYGFSAGQAPIDVAITLHREIGAKVVLVGCDCDGWMKKQSVLPHLMNGDIEWLILGPSCGGEYDLSTIMQTVIRMWSGRMN